MDYVMLMVKLYVYVFLFMSVELHQSKFGVTMIGQVLVDFVFFQPINRLFNIHIRFLCFKEMINNKAYITLVKYFHGFQKIA